MIKFNPFWCRMDKTNIRLRNGERCVSGAAILLTKGQPHSAVFALAGKGPFLHIRDLILWGAPNVTPLIISCFIYFYDAFGFGVHAIVGTSAATQRIPNVSGTWFEHVSRGIAVFNGTTQQVPAHKQRKPHIHRKKRRPKYFERFHRRFQLWSLDTRSEAEARLCRCEPTHGTGGAVTLANVKHV